MPNVLTYRLFGFDASVTAGHRSDTWVFVTYWLFASPIILSSFQANEGMPAWIILVFYGYMVVAYSACAWIIVNVFFPSYMPRRRYALGFIAVLLLLVVCSIGTEALEALIYADYYFSWMSILRYDLPNDAQNILTIVAILAGKKYFDERQRTTQLESERRQSELQRLRAQVDPHFLFNALNILDILIEQSPDEARHFVHRLSNLYRYLIRHRDEDLVPAAEELAHARDYRYLVERRFGHTFRFRENLAPEDLEGLYLPPGALQTVLENVFKHNVASASAPVQVNLGLSGKTLTIANDYRPKPGRATSISPGEVSGAGLENLRRRVALMSDATVTAGREGERWVVRVPLVTTSPVLANPQGRVSTAHTHDGETSLGSGRAITPESNLA